MSTSQFNLDAYIDARIEERAPEIMRKVLESQPPAKDFYTEEEFCAAAKISRTTAWRKRNNGELKYSEIGRQVIYLREHLIDYLKSNERNGSK
jgi:hypothetical protein